MLRIRLFALTAILLSLLASFLTPAVSEGSLTFTDDFSSYPVGQPPAGWDQFGTSAITPVIEQVGGTGSAHNLLSFPSLGAGNTDKWLIYRGFSCTRATATVKINFQENADSAGLMLAWVDPNNFIRVQPNVYWGYIGFDEWVNGVWRTRIGSANLPINPYTDYWLRVTTYVDGTGSHNATVYWSTDGVTFQNILTVNNLVSLTGRVGLVTSGFNLPHTHFDDFSLTGNCGSLQVPTFGNVGFLFHQQLAAPNGCLDTNNPKKSHQGIDIWSNQDGKGLTPPSPEGQVVRAAYWGTILGIFNSDDKPVSATDAKAAIIELDHPTFPGKHIYTLYAHMANADGTQTFIAPGLYVGKSVAQGELLGYQGNATGKSSPNSLTPDGTAYLTHLHFEVKTAAAARNQVDPSPYIGWQVNRCNPGYPGWLDFFP